MEFLKFCGGITVIASGAFCGIYASKMLENRVCFLEQYIMFLTQTKTMISYNAVSVENIFSSVGSVPVLQPMLGKCLKMLSDGYTLQEAWYGAVNSAYVKKLCTASDRTLILSFGDTFGSSNVDGEVTKTELHTALVTERLEKARQELYSKRKIYRTVGMFCGMMIVFVLY